MLISSGTIKVEHSPLLPWECNTVVPVYSFNRCILLAFSTMISWSYYGERCWAYLFGDNSSLIYKIIFLTFTFLGSIITATNILDFSDLMILGMAFPNILGLLILSGNVSRYLKKYETSLKVSNSL